MKLIIDISKDRYDEIMSMDWKNCRLIFDEEIRAIHDGKALEQEPCDDAVDRQVVIDAIDDDNRNGHYSCFATNNDAECFKQIIRDLPSVTPQPCGDAINRHAVIDTLTKTSGIRGDALKALYDLPSVTPMQKWIPVSERLPEEDGEYLATIYDMDENYEYIDIAELEDGKWCYKPYILVKAWMPIPEPYKAEGSDKE